MRAWHKMRNMFVNSPLNLRDPRWRSADTLQKRTRNAMIVVPTFKNWSFFKEGHGIASLRGGHAALHDSGMLNSRHAWKTLWKLSMEALWKRYGGAVESKMGSNLAYDRSCQLAPLLTGRSCQNGNAMETRKRKT